MIVSRLTRLIREGVSNASGELGLDKVPDESEIELERPPRKEMGDFSTNVALMLGSRVANSLPPRVVAETIIKNLPRSDLVSEVEVAGPGFINFRVRHEWLYEVLLRVAREGDRYGRGEPTGSRVQVEFVSANPTGPLHVGTARNAVLGDSLANLLEAAGDTVEREYYFNDANRQMELFGESVEARYLELFGREASIPEVIPADVTIFPWSTQRTPRTQRTRG